MIHFHIESIKWEYHQLYRFYNLKMENHQDDFLHRNWEEYDQLRMDRVRQQRQRMENMKDVVEQYTKIIKDLQNKNHQLLGENQTFYHYKQLYSQQLIHNQQLNDKYKWATNELEHQQNQNRQLETYIQQLTKDPLNQNYNMNPHLTEKYEDLALAYYQVKDQLYRVQRQNLQLKEAIKGQSKLFYQSNRFKPILDDKTIKKEGGNTKDNKENKSLKKTSDQMMKEQLKKQSEIIEKYKHTEQQHCQLIQILKTKANCQNSASRSKKSFNSRI